MREEKELIKSDSRTNRRNFIAKTIFAGAGLAAGSLALTAQLNKADAQTGGSGTQRTNVSDAKNAAGALPGRRRLGTLEVSSVGLGVQNMSRTYQTTVPYRPEMIDIIRAAFDRGVTFYDAAEAYGPQLSASDLGQLDDAASMIKIEDNRYPPELEARVGR